MPEIEITGHDSVVLTFTRPGEVFARLAASVLARWPAALVDDLDGSLAGPVPLGALPASRLPAGPGWLVFYRDAAMLRHMDAVAYAPMADGDGPFAVAVRTRRGVEFEAAGLAERRAADHAGQIGSPPDPYRAWLCTPELVEVTAVTPGDPGEHSFSAWALGEVKRVCRGGGESGG